MEASYYHLLPLLVGVIGKRIPPMSCTDFIPVASHTYIHMYIYIYIYVYVYIPQTCHVGPWQLQSEDELLAKIKAEGRKAGIVGEIVPKSKGFQRWQIEVSDLFGNEIYNQFVAL